MLRVAKRVSQGGHSIPEDATRRRSQAIDSALAEVSGKLALREVGRFGRFWPVHYR